MLASFDLVITIIMFASFGSAFPHWWILILQFILDLVCCKRWVHITTFIVIQIFVLLVCIIWFSHNQCYVDIIRFHPTNAVNSLLSNMYGEWDVLVTCICQLHEKISQEPSFYMIITISGLLHISIFCYKVRLMHFCFSSCVEVWLGDSRLSLKDSGYTIMRSQIHPASSVSIDHCN
jgi:hypothetical protein